jgi:predicted RNase H-like HicB family nuclease
MLLRVDASQELGQKHMIVKERTMVAVVSLVHEVHGTYGVSFPDFPGCIAGGETLDEALQRGRAGLQLHVESMIEVGETLPKIRDAAEIKADPEYAEDFVAAVVAQLDVDIFVR